MGQGVSKRLRACIVGHIFVRRLGESLECEARQDGTVACVGVAAPGLLRVDDVYNEVWTLGRSGYTLHWIRSDIFTTGNLFPDVIILNCGLNDLCDRFVNIEGIADGLVSYVHLLTVSFGVKIVYIMARQVPSSERCRVLVPCAVAQPCSVCPCPAIWRDPFRRHEGILALPWWIVGAARVRMVPGLNPPQLFRRCPEIPA